MMAPVTTPRAANPADVKQTVQRLLRWLREHEHTESTSAAEYVQVVLEKGDAHRAGSVPALVSEALVLAYGTQFRTSSATGRRAVSTLRVAQTHTKSLVLALSQLERDLAARGGAISEPTLSDLGNRAVAALARVQRRVESFGNQRSFPATLAEWQKFTGRTCAGLVGAGMAWKEAASFFPEDGVDSAITQERLRKRAQRRPMGAQSRSGKKIPGRKG